MDPAEDLAHRFGRDVLRGAAELARLGYDAAVFRGMVAEHGPVEAARRLVLDPVPSHGLWRLKELRRLDTSVELWVLLPWYEPLFGPEVRERAERKLRLLDVDVEAELGRVVSRFARPDRPG